MGSQSTILAIVGDSAAGKTTLAAGVAALLSPSPVATLGLDDYHRYSRAEREARGLTALHPDCNDLELIEAHLGRLAAGQPIQKPVYNHTTGSFDHPQLLRPAPFVIAEGLLGLATPALRRAYSLSIFLDPPDALREQWKIARDCQRRGYTLAQVQAEIARRRADAAEFIRPQRAWADVVVRFFAAQPATPPEQLSVRLLLRSGLGDLEPGELIARQVGGRPALRLRVGRDEGLLTEVLEIDGQIGAAQATQVADLIYARRPGLRQIDPEQLGGFMDGRAPRSGRALAVVQLLIAQRVVAGG